MRTVVRPGPAFFASGMHGLGPVFCLFDMVIALAGLFRVIRNRLAPERCGVGANIFREEEGRLDG